MKRIIYTIIFSIVAETTFQRLHAQHNMPGLTGIETCKNHIITRTYTSEDSAYYLDAIQYFDGFGNHVQTIQKNFTPQGSDLVTNTEYDALGRKWKHWLPVPINNSTGAFVPSSTILMIATSVYNNDSRPYSENIYEDSPFNRLERQYGPGASWHSNNKRITTSYNANDVSITYFYVNAQGYLQRGNNYDPASLYKTTTTDEDNKSVTKYADKFGRVVMTRQSSNHDTYYVYNNLGQCCYVLPPLAVDGLKNHSTASYISDNHDILKKYAYLYKYDNRGNQTYKRLPGCEPVYMVYDQSNRLILSQDGCQRVKYDSQQRNKWTLHKYDVFGRIQYSSEINLNGNHQNLINYFSNYIVTETFTVGSQPYPMEDTGYSRGWYHAVPSKLLVVNYYDDYQFLDKLPSTVKTNLTYDTNREAEYGVRHPSAKGLLTGTRTYLLDGSNTYLTTAYYYDYRGRIIQTRANNHMDGYDIRYSQYDFTGNITQSLSEHSNTANHSNPLTELYRYTYDHAGRMINTKYKLNNNAEVTLATNHYDELGRLVTKNRHNNNPQAGYTYAYNIRNQITWIESDYFTEKIYYNVKYNGYGNVSTPCWNGNISHVECSDGASYNYYYDQLNRLTNANSINIPEDCNESFFYDKHGNITGIWRHGQAGVYHIDNLSFQYNGNQIRKITDHADSQNSYSVKEYQDLADEQTEFFYDANGNLITDLDRNIVTIRYNLLNLPDTIQFKNGRQIINRYDATGQKLSTMYVTPIYPLSAPLTAGATIGTDNSSFRRYGTLYNANVEYTLAYNGNRTLARIHNTEGYALPSNVMFYHRKDHLGSIRSLWSTNYNYDDRYYPSGLPWSNNTGYDVGPYKYNGKEFIETHGLDEYDSYARWYYPAIMRTTTMDPLAEKYYDVSPYAWCGNNPVNVIDPDGREVIALNSAAQRAILNTLPKEIRGQIQFDNIGRINRSSFNQINSSSGNFGALSQLVNDNTIFEVNVADKITYKNERGRLIEQSMGKITLSDDKNGSFGFNTGEDGWQGVTQTPGDAPEKYNSPDGNVRIVINSGLSVEGQAQNFAHEAYGHGYLYSKGQEHRHQVKSTPEGFRETNTNLRDAITRAIKETIDNILNR